MNSSQILGIRDAKRILEANRSDLALLIGNGINRASADSGGLSWSQLMENLVAEASQSTTDPVVTRTRLLRLLERRKNLPTPASFPEVFDILDATADHKLPGYITHQTSIAKMLMAMRPGPPHRALVNWAAHETIPVLTTNYDHCLQDALGNAKCRRRRIGSGSPLSDVYPWDRYYATEDIKDPLTAFAIWHIHGDRDMHRSIRAGLDQYMGMVERLRKLKAPIAKEAFRGPEGDQKIPAFHAAPWLRIFLGKKLWIQGLGLGPDETSIRWLLIQRFRYWSNFRACDRFKSGWYVHSSAKEVGPLDDARRTFFESVGVQVISIDEAADAYTKLFEETPVTFPVPPVPVVAC